MNETTLTDLGNKEKVTIYLAEYSTLRSEVIARINTRWAVLGIGAGVISVLVSGKVESVGRLVLAFSLTCLALAFSWWQTWHYILRCVRRIREIERAVNHLAGEDLLVWETRMKEERQENKGVNRVLSTPLDADG
jgi:hypothetical protein